MLGDAPAFMVTVSEYCQFPATVAVVTVPPFVQEAGSVVAVAVLWVTTNPLFAAVKPPVTLYITPDTACEVEVLTVTDAAKETIESAAIINMGANNFMGIRCLSALIRFMISLSFEVLIYLPMHHGDT